MLISSILPREAVVARLPAQDKKQALKMMAVQAATLIKLSEKEIYNALLEREHIGCTGMGNGVCVPHGRFEGLSSLQAVFASIEKPIEFGAADGRPVDLIFMLLSPLSANTEHLKALAMISRVLRDKTLCEALRKADNAQSLYTLLTNSRGEDAA